MASSHENLEPETETESVVSLRQERPRRRDSSEHGGEGVQAPEPGETELGGGAGSSLAEEEGQEAWFLRFSFLCSWGPQAQRPLEAGAPPGWL